MHKLQLANIFSLCLITGIILGCSTARHSVLAKEITNQGPKALSEDNPYIVSNLYLAEEIKRNEVMRGFISYRGTPSAIEIRKQFFGPSRLYLFYLDKNEAYLFKDRSGNWIVQGPEKIPANVSPSLAGIPKNSGRAAMTTESNLPIVRDDVPEPLFTDSTDKKPSHAVQSKSVVASKRVGDYLHQVTFPGETLRLIARWYTGTADNTPRLARINDISNPDVLYLGQSIKIPQYLLKNTHPLPESEVSKYIEDSLPSPSQ